MPIPNSDEIPQFDKNGDEIYEPDFIGGPEGDGDIIDFTKEKFCRAPDCGHMERLHTPTCSGINVVGVPNTLSSDWPCRCQRFQETDPRSVTNWEV